MKNKKIICNKCAKEIKSKDELVTTFKFIKIVSYHSKCYSDELKSINTIFISNKPINAMVSNIVSITISILALILILLGNEEVIFLLIIPLVRLYSLIMIENHV